MGFGFQIFEEAEGEGLSTGIQQGTDVRRSRKIVAKKCVLTQNPSILKGYFEILPFKIDVFFF